MAKRTYRYFQGEPLYPFGYGLSYSSFTYVNAKVNAATVAANGAVEISTDVTNSGKILDASSQPIPSRSSKALLE